MAGGASGFISGEVQMSFLHPFRLIAMASQAGSHRIRLQEARRFAGVRIVASHTFALRTRMLDLCLVDLFGLLTVTADTHRTTVAVRQDDFSVLRRRVAGVAHLVFER